MYLTRFKNLLYAKVSDTKKKKNLWVLCIKS